MEFNWATWEFLSLKTQIIVYAIVLASKIFLGCEKAKISSC